MRKRLTAAAHCAIKMRSEEPNKSRAVQLLWEDLQNGPLHCFGIHDNCSTDYCTATHKTSSSPDTSLVGSSSPNLSSVTVSSPGPSSLIDSNSPDLSSIAGSPCMYVRVQMVVALMLVSALLVPALVVSLMTQVQM